MMPEPIIDVNVSLGQWPTRRVACDDVSTLVAKLREHGVSGAICGSFDGLFHDDLGGVNDHLVAVCRAHDRDSLKLVPFGEINPLQTGWDDELTRCVDHHGMRGIRLHPNYHGYRLDHPQFANLLKAAAERRIVVQLVVLMEDERMMHPLMRIPPVDLTPLAAMVEQMSGLQLMLLNALKGQRDEALLRMLRTGRVACDIAMLEGAGTLETLIGDVPIESLVFGSHVPCLYFESSLLKLKESALPAPHTRALMRENVARFLNL
jgi:predicted TIM-barrel fold metal-dependent hydrolase